MDAIDLTQGALREGSLKGKTILITGGGTGLGRSMGAYFLKLGANIIIVSRKLAVLEQAAKEMEEETGGRVLPLACDIRNSDDVEKVIQQGLTHF
jgi:short-subunit dehydrogenase